MNIKEDFSWDGEKIVHKRTFEDEKHSPMDLINSYNNLQKQINDFLNGISQAEQQLKTHKKNLEAAREFEAKIKPFQEKCWELQKEKLLSFIERIMKESVEKAKKQAEEEISKAPDSYTGEHLEKLPYLKFQHLIAVLIFLLKPLVLHLG